MDEEIIMTTLQVVARILATIPTEDLDRYVRACETANSRHEAFAPILDPSAYFDNQRSGKFQDAKNQGVIARHLLTARKAIDEREGFAASVRLGTKLDHD